MFTDDFELLILQAMRSGFASMGFGRFLTLHNGDPGESGTLNDITQTVLGDFRIDVSTVTFGLPVFNSATDRWESQNTSNITFTPIEDGIFDFLVWHDSMVPLIRISTDPILLSAWSTVTLGPGSITIGVSNVGETIATEILNAIGDANKTNIFINNTYWVAFFSSLNGNNVGTEITDSLGLQRTQLPSPDTNFATPANGSMLFNAGVLMRGAPNATTPIPIVALYSDEFGGDLQCFVSLNPLVSPPLLRSIVIQNLRITVN